MTGLLYFTLGFSSMLIESCKAYLNETEQKITLSLMNELKISHCILVAENKKVDLAIFKNFAYKALIYQNIDYLSEFIKSESYPDQKTIIVSKVQKLSIVVDFFKKLYEIKKDRKIYAFTWLIFVDWSKSTEGDENDLLLPLDSQFFVVHYILNLGWKLVEIFRVKKGTFFFDYAIWNDKNETLVISNYSWYKRRSDLGNMAIPLTGRLQTEMYGACKKIKMQCAHFVFLEWLELKMNFSLNHTKEPDSKSREEIQKDFRTIDIIISDYPGNLKLYSNPHFHTMSRMSAPIFQQNLNWIIKRPESYKRSDYTQPFHKDVWTSIFITICLTSTTLLLLTYFLQSYIETDKNFELLNTIFIPLDCFTEQNSATNLSILLPIRIAIFTIRFTSIFIVSTYLATVTSYMAVDDTEIPFTNPKEFLDNGEYIINVPERERQCRDFFEASTDSVIQEIKEKLYKTEPTLDIIIGKVCNEKIAAVSYELGAQLQHLQWPCEIHVIDPPLQITKNVLLMSKRIPFKKIFDYHLIQFHSSGIRQRAEKEFLNPEIFDDNDSQFDSIGLDEITQVLILLLAGLVIAKIIFIVQLGFSWICTGHLIKILDKVKIEV